LPEASGPVLGRFGCSAGSPCSLIVVESADDTHSRYIEAAIGGIVIGCLYLPNGNPAPGPKFDTSCGGSSGWRATPKPLLKRDAPAILAGDFNVMPTELDVYAPERWIDDALFRPEVRDAYRCLVAQGWTDALRALHPDERVYTFWKYLRNACARDAGLRIDHLLLSPSLAACLVAAGVDRDVRARERSSDYAPVWIELADASAGSARPAQHRRKDRSSWRSTRSKSRPVGVIETSAAIGACLLVLVVAITLDRRPYQPGKWNFVPIMIIAVAASLVLGRHLLTLVTNNW
jgi:exodeoxyribonuclease III